MFFTNYSYQILSQHSDYGLIKKNTVSDVDLIKDPNFNYTRILLAGDILQEENHIHASFNKDSNSYFYNNWFKQIRPILFIGDIVIGNLETTFSGTPYSGNQYYSAPDEFLRSLKRSGFNVLLNANDKISDFEGFGITRTLDKLDEIGMRHTGAFRNIREKEKTYPLIIKVHDIKVAILNYTSQAKKQIYTEEIYNKLSLSQVKNDIQTAKEKGAEYIIVYMHWGNEFDAKVLDYQKSIANTCINYGADAIIGANTHIFQPIEIRSIEKNNLPSTAIIAYSLGDFLPASNDPKINNSAIIEIMLKKDKNTGAVSIHDYGYIPIWTQIEKNNFTILPITNVDENEILNIKLNFKQYSEAKTAMNAMRGIMFERMEEIHYNISDKIVEDVDQTYLLQKDNPSLIKVAENPYKDTLTKAQIAYIEMFGTRSEKEKLYNRFQSPKEIEDARIIAFKTQIKKRDLNRKSLNETVAEFNIPVFETKTIRPQVETEKTQIRQPIKSIKTAKPILQIYEIDKSEILYTINIKDIHSNTSINETTNSKQLVVNTARKNNFRDYPKISNPSTISSSNFNNNSSKNIIQEINSKNEIKENEIANEEDNLGNENTQNTKPSTINSNLLKTNTNENSKNENKLNIQIQSNEPVIKNKIVTNNSEPTTKNTNDLKSSSLSNKLPNKSVDNSFSNSTNTKTNTNNNITSEKAITPTDNYKPTTKNSTNYNYNSKTTKWTPMPNNASDNTGRNSPAPAKDNNVSTKVLSQVIDSSGKVQTIIRRLEVVSNKPTPNLPYRPKTGGGIFTISEPSQASTSTVRSNTETAVKQTTSINQIDDINYYVQVYAFSEKYIINTDLNPSLKYYEIVIEEGQYKYLLGKSKNMIQVAKQCQELRDKGYTDAFMVKYVNGKRVPFIGN